MNAMDGPRTRHGSAPAGEAGVVTDAHAVPDHPRRGPDPEARRRRAFRRRAIQVFLATLFLAGGVAALVGERGWVDHSRLERKIERQADELARLEARVEALRERRRALREDPLERERLARERLDLAAPDEILFLLPPEADPGDAPPDAGR